MKKLEFKISVPDKYTNKQYEAGTIYEFEDARAEEILKARTAVTREPYAVEVVETVENDVEEVTEEVVQAVANAIVEQAEEDNKTIEKVVNEIVEESKPKRKRKTKQDN